jgi:hypothetical protein
MRLAVLGRPQITGEMYSLLTTLSTGTGNALTPHREAVGTCAMAKCYQARPGSCDRNGHRLCTVSQAPGRDHPPRFCKVTELSQGLTVSIKALDSSA